MGGGFETARQKEYNEVMKKTIGWLVLAGLVLIVALRWVEVRDWASGMLYQPSGEMVEIRENLGLTDRGEFLFNAAQPVLMGQEKFNDVCLKTDTETAILGCYMGRKIYVYNVAEADLAGILEATTAHELLHAVYGRMDSGEKAQVKGDLETVLTENQEILAEDLALYDESERSEELYVRVGTEVRDLPEALEAHYAEIFVDQDAIVQYYTNYSGKFREIELKLEGLAEELEALRGEIEQKTADYEANLGVLEAKIADFNACAGVVGCFSDVDEFNDARNELQGEKGMLAVACAEINELVELYNCKVDDYNAVVMVGEKYDRAIKTEVGDGGF